MTKKKKLVKNALSHPELFTPGELAYFNLWLKSKKEIKKQKKLAKKENTLNSTD